MRERTRNGGQIPFKKSVFEVRKTMIHEPEQSTAME
jgi:hypothetical protein